MKLKLVSTYLKILLSHYLGRCICPSDSVAFAVSDKGN